MALPAGLQKKAFMFFVIIALVLIACWYAPVWYVFIGACIVLALWETWWLPWKKHSGDQLRAFWLGIVAIIGFSMMIWLRTFEHGFAYVLAGLIIVAATDTVANIIGALLGKRTGITARSPNKSLEGFIGGIHAGAITTFVSLMILLEVYGSTDIVGLQGRPSILFVVSIPLLPLLAIWGDLHASGIKRALGDADQGGIKDFSAIFGSHGGVMDRFDSQVWVFPFYMFVLWQLQLLQ